MDGWTNGWTDGWICLLLLFCFVGCFTKIIPWFTVILCLTVTVSCGAAKRFFGKDMLTTQRDHEVDPGSTLYCLDLLLQTSLQLIQS
jgi:hypothetical protein